MKKKILLIDDEEIVLKSIAKLLIREGYEVIACRSGTEAIDQAKSEAVDLIVCDVRMPQLNGIETVRRIRDLIKSSTKKPTPEILITGYADQMANREIESLQVAEYLYKPFDLRDFLGAVKKALKT
ncbi:MAG: response regulator [Candidatus Omnitrophica bacterium]|nr:response regulator [Candidatus Omnitrophota bacterium]